MHLNPCASRPTVTYDNCVHQMFQDCARTQPEALAISAWDAQLTYAELDTLSTSLAAYLAQHGVGPEVYVPIYSEKSSWVPVAMLAVLKAGGAFILLDSAHPRARLEEICRTVGATRIVSSSQYAKEASRLAPEVFITGVHSSPQPHSVVVNVNPGNVAYAIFTSGSSGRPKGVAIEHRAFCSSAMAHASALNMNHTSRVLQFASYAFDACLTEILTALIEGRTIDLAGEARRLQPNWALLTPSVARICDVADFPMLQTLVLGGEAITEEDVRKWAPHTNLFVAYGVSEAAVVNLARPCRFGVGLAATGAVGELYISDPVRTADAFIDAPLWYSRLESEARSDTAGSKLPTDGSIRYIGRKDDMRKINGQRLQMAEVEHSLRSLLPQARHLVVDVVKLGGFEALVAFISPETQPVSQHFIPSDTWLLDPNEDLRAQAHVFQQQLQETIPQWMIPSFFLPLQHMPLTLSGKSDRQALRSLAATLTQNQLQSYGTAPTRKVKREPSTPMEKVTQQLWASVLQIPASSIGLDDHLMELGGTSIHIMKLAGAARRQGLLLSVGDALRSGSLAEMAASLKPTSMEESAPLLPFELIHKSDHHDMLIDRAVQICQLRDRGDIEDMYPCTPMQEGLMSLTARKPGAYTAAFEYELPTDVDIDRFRRAWDLVVDANPILRTRFIQSTSGIMYQAVVRGTLLWESEIGAKSVSDDWQLGQPLARLGLRQHGDQYAFIFIIHHALTDGWALPLILEQAQTVYDGAIFLPSRPFNRFIDYISKTDYKAFWGRYFDGSHAVSFPSLPSASFTPEPTARKTLTIQVDTPEKNEYSVPNRLKLAWGILVSLYTDSSDIVFGVTVAGRAAPVLGIEDMSGPTIASVPYRLCLEPAMSVSEALRKAEAASACSALQTLLVIQPHRVDPQESFRVCKDLAAFNAFSTYAINLICQQSPGSVDIDATFDPRVINETQFGLKKTGSS
ncbi:acetyl-CoA synthetase-like protein [Nemania sp. NC0429]|nr:acetyl-CoA synthetase-like protein [Nemania sp. NC0429]